MFLSIVCLYFFHFLFFLTFSNFPHFPTPCFFQIWGLGHPKTPMLRHAKVGMPWYTMVCHGIPPYHILIHRNDRRSRIFGRKIFARENTDPYRCIAFDLPGKLENFFRNPEFFRNSTNSLLHVNSSCQSPQSL